MFVTKLRGSFTCIGTGVVGATLAYSLSRRGQVSFVHAEAAKTLEDAQVVIVGGGYGGVAAAMKLKDHCNLTLIDSREALHHNMGAQRSSVQPGPATLLALEPTLANGGPVLGSGSDATFKLTIRRKGFSPLLSGFAKKCFITYEPTFGKSFKQGQVNGVLVNEKKVQLTSGETVSYDYLIIATGTGGPFPCKLGLDVNAKEGISKYEDMAKQVVQAQKIVVIGGGAAGVELSGDIKEDYENKDVTLIHPREILVNDKVNESFQKTIKDRLKVLGVKTILGERVSNMEELSQRNFKNVTVKTDKGKSIQADLAITCTGLKVHSSAYKTTLADKMDKMGRLKVDNYLQVQGITDVYAIGDCCGTPELKVATGAQAHGEHVAANIKLKAEGKQPKPYTINEKTSMCLCVGRGGGAVQMSNGWVFGDWFARFIKGKDVFVSMVWKAMGRQVPPD